MTHHIVQWAKAVIMPTPNREARDISPLDYYTNRTNRMYPISDNPGKTGLTLFFNPDGIG